MVIHQDLVIMPDSSGLTIILPVYNEEECVIQELERIIQSAKKIGNPFEIILIDDFSKDNSKKLIEDFLTKNNQFSNESFDVKFLKNRKNFGSGYSRKVGSISAKFDNIVWTDVDMSYPNDEIHLLYDHFKKTGSDMCVGNRTSEEGTFKFLRFPVKYLIRKFAEFLSEEKIEDLNSGFRIFKKNIAEKYFNLLPKGFSCVTTITLSFLCNDHFVNYIDIKYSKRAGISKFHFIKDTFKYIRQIILMTVIYNPLKVYFLVFLIFLFASLFISIYGFIKFNTIPNSAVTLFIASIIFLALGSLAEAIRKK